MIFETKLDLTASATKSRAGYFLLVSQFTEKSTKLVLAKHMEIRGNVSTQLRSEISNAKGLDTLNPIGLRNCLSGELASAMTSHILQVLDQNVYLTNRTDVVVFTSWYYKHLVSWGEASAAKVLSRLWGIPVATIQNRLKIARARGILKSPGQGSRRGS